MMWWHSQPIMASNHGVALHKGCSNDQQWVFFFFPCERMSASPTHSIGACIRRCLCAPSISGCGGGRGERGNYLE